MAITKYTKVCFYHRERCDSTENTEFFKKSYGLWKDGMMVPMAIEDLLGFYEKVSIFFRVIANGCFIICSGHGYMVAFTKRGDWPVGLGRFFIPGLRFTPPPGYLLHPFGAFLLEGQKATTWRNLFSRG